MKPIDYTKFSKAIDRVFTLCEANAKSDQQAEYIFIKTGGLLLKIKQKDIVCCEALVIRSKFISSTKLMWSTPQ